MPATDPSVRATSCCRRRRSSASRRSHSRGSAPMTLTITPEARHAIDAWLSCDPSRPMLRLSFAGGCGALGYRLTPAAPGARRDEQTVMVEGLAIYVDF